MTDEEIAAYCALDMTYVSGTAGFFNVGGDNFATCMYRNVPYKREAGKLLYERRPTLLLIRPREGLRHLWSDMERVLGDSTVVHLRSTG